MFFHRLRAIFSGDLVGVDDNGIRYYASRYPHPLTKRRQRWAIFSDSTDATCISPQWHLWLHHTTMKPPEHPFSEAIIGETGVSPAPIFHNLSGTQHAYWPVFVKKMCFNRWKPKRQKKGTLNNAR
ncbi:MAG: hypothetical protein H6849_04055 [Alphaproteobacteria bacterium]|nr:MAG: hypothetical protein H6849_04055 [Alphaproteobacteria bacterium]